MPSSHSVTRGISTTYIKWPPFLLTTSSQRHDRVTYTTPTSAQYSNRPQLAHHRTPLFIWHGSGNHLSITHRQDGDAFGIILTSHIPVAVRGTPSRGTSRSRDGSRPFHLPRASITPFSLSRRHADWCADRSSAGGSVSGLLGHTQRYRPSVSSGRLSRLSTRGHTHIHRKAKSAPFFGIRRRRDQRASDTLGVSRVTPCTASGWLSAWLREHGRVCFRNSREVLGK